MKEKLMRNLRAVRLLLAAALALAALLVIGQAGAKSTAVACGDTLTSNTSLSSDLDCSGYAGDALTIGKNGIKLDLKGHTITGFAGADSYNGVNTNGYNSITITNGKITGFDYDVYLEQSSNVKVSKLKLSGDNADTDDWGVYIYYGAGNTVDSVTINDGTGVTDGLYSDYSGGLMVTNSQVVNPATYGFETYEDTGDVFKKDKVSGSGGTGYGFYDDYSYNNTYKNDMVSDTDYGWYLDCDGYGNVTLKGNSIKNANSYGFYIYYCYNSYAGYMPTSLINGNSAANGSSYGFFDEYSIGATFSSNTANGNSSYGMYFDYPTGQYIQGNTANGNGGTGIDLVDNYSYYNALDFSKNKGNNNDYGLYAAYGVPGKSNSASGNATWDCFNVVCPSSPIHASEPVRPVAAPAAPQPKKPPRPHH
jgi:hypothetical protein